jgi:Pyridine nucleotide-disulphide oxidoreductase, dimerisation domain/EamA-like transporter family
VIRTRVTSIPARRAASALPPTAYTWRPNLRSVWALGDVIGGAHLRHQFTHVATYEGPLVAENALLGCRHQPSYNAIPRVTFTDREIAAVGLADADAQAAGHDVATQVKLIREVGKARTLGEDEGFVKLVLDRASRSLLGATIVAAHAGDLLAELTIPMHVDGATLAPLLAPLHAHPTLSEAVKAAARDAAALSRHADDHTDEQESICRPRGRGVSTATTNTPSPDSTPPTSSRWDSPSRPPPSGCCRESGAARARASAVGTSCSARSSRVLRTRSSTTAWSGRALRSERCSSRSRVLRSRFSPPPFSASGSTGRSPWVPPGRRGAVVLATHEAQQGASLTGDALVVAGVVAAAGYSVVARRLAPGADAAVVTAYQLTAALALALVVWLAGRVGERPMLGHPSASQWLAALATGVLGSAVPFLLYSRGVTRAGPSRGSPRHLWALPASGRRSTGRAPPRTPLSPWSSGRLTSRLRRSRR